MDASSTDAAACGEEILPDRENVSLDEFGGQLNAFAVAKNEWR